MLLFKHFQTFNIVTCNIFPHVLARSDVLIYNDVMSLYDYMTYMTIMTLKYLLVVLQQTLGKHRCQPLGLVLQRSVRVFYEVKVTSV